MTQRDEGHNYRDSKNKAREYERKQKYEAIIDMVIRWLDSNIDDWEDDKTKYILNSEDQKQMIKKNAIAQDSADLKENCFWDDWMQNAIKVYSETEITNEQTKTLKELGVIY